MARQRRRAAIEEVDEPGIAHDAEVPAEVVVVAALGLGDRRRDARTRRHDDGVEGRGERLYLADVLRAQMHQTDVIGARKTAAHRDALADARIVFRGAMNVGLVNVDHFGTRDAAALEVFRLAIEGGHRHFNDQRPGKPQALQ